MALCDLSDVSRTDASWRDPCALPQNFRYVAVMTRGSGLVRIRTMRPVREFREENIRATRPHGLYLDAVVGTVSNSSRMPDSVLRKTSGQLLSLHRNLCDCPLHLFHNDCSESPLTQCFPLYPFQAPPKQHAWVWTAHCTHLSRTSDGAQKSPCLFDVAGDSRGGSTHLRLRGRTPSAARPQRAQRPRNLGA